MNTANELRGQLTYRDILNREEQELEAQMTDAMLKEQAEAEEALAPADEVIGSDA